RRHGGYCGRRDAKRGAQPLRIFLKTVSNGDGCSDPAQRQQRRYPFHTIEQRLETFAREKFRLGGVARFVYAADHVKAFIADEAHRDQMSPSPAMSKTCKISWPASSTASSPIASLPPPRLGAATKERVSKSIRCTSPPTFTSC